MFSMRNITAPWPWQYRVLDLCLHAQYCSNVTLACFVDSFARIGCWMCYNMHLPLLQPDHFKSMMPQLMLYLMSVFKGSEASSLNVQPLIKHVYQLHVCLVMPVKTWESLPNVVMWHGMVLVAFFWMWDWKGVLTLMHVVLITVEMTCYGDELFVQ
jgi:hypothetical protein